MTKKLTTEEFIKRANKVHNCLYDYTKVNYQTAHVKICIIDPKYGEFWQTPSAHLYGAGSPTRNGGIKLITKEFIRRAKKVHDNLYDYSKVKYQGAKIKVCIIDPEYGEFWQAPVNHLSGRGNIDRGRQNTRTARRLSTKEFISRAKEIHNELYNYSKVNYVNYDTKVCIIDPKYGEFWQTPDSHLAGKGNPIRSIGNISKLENDWLDSLNLPNLERQKKILLKNNTFFRPDAYDSETHTVYEFWGDYWHGNPDKYNPEDQNSNNKKTFGELYEATQNKIQRYKDHGYHVVDIWENDYKIRRSKS